MAERISTADAHPCTGCGAPLRAGAEWPLRCSSCGTEHHRRAGRRLVDRDWASVADGGDPEALVVPFAVDRVGAQRALRAWARGHRFAPRSFRRLDRGESLMDVYVPYWVWEAETRSRYRGERGRHHWRTDGSGRRFRRTRWEPVAGTVTRSFSGVAVPATPRVPRRLLPEPALDRSAVPCRPEDRRRAMPAEVGPEAGLAEAKLRMDELVRRETRLGIGGDEQRVRSIDTAYAGLRCRSLLVPVWLSTHTSGGRSRQVVVCGRTGRVAGDRPRSVWKVSGAVSASVLVTLIAAIFLVSSL